MNAAKSKEDALSALLNTKASLLDRISVASSVSSDAAPRNLFFEGLLDEEKSLHDRGAADGQHGYSQSNGVSGWPGAPWDGYRPSWGVSASGGGDAGYRLQATARSSSVSLFAHAIPSHENSRQ
eukprot:5790636-Pyramimonas_sp.AAC.1